MPKPQKRPRVSTPDRKGIFGQGAEALRVGLYARVSTHDQQTLPMQMSAMRDYAKRRRWTIVIEVQDSGSGATTRPKREKLIETARDRPGSGVTAGSMGAVVGGSGQHAPGVDRVGSGLRFIERSLGSDDSERPRAGRDAGGVCRVRKGHAARLGEGGNRSGKKGREAAWAAQDRREAEPGNETALQGRAE